MASGAPSGLGRQPSLSSRLWTAISEPMSKIADWLPPPPAHIKALKVSIVFGVRGEGGRPGRPAPACARKGGGSVLRGVRQVEVLPGACVPRPSAHAAAWHARTLPTRTHETTPLLPWWVAVSGVHARGRARGKEQLRSSIHRRCFLSPDATPLLPCILAALHANAHPHSPPHHRPPTPCCAPRGPAPLPRSTSSPRALSWVRAQRAPSSAASTARQGRW